MIGFTIWHLNTLYCLSCGNSDLAKFQVWTEQAHPRGEIELKGSICQCGQKHPLYQVRTKRMPSKTLKCSCGQRLFLYMPLRVGTATQEMILAHDAGWLSRGGAWFCGEGCAARAAKDVTPNEARLTDG